MSGSMVYEVSLVVDVSLAERLMAWLRPHVREMLTFDGFESARINRQAHASGSQTEFCVQYVLKDRACFHRYETAHAARMRAEGINAFPKGLSATRKMWQLCEVLSSVQST